MEGARVTKQAKKTKPQNFEKELPFKIKNGSAGFVRVVAILEN